MPRVLHLQGFPPSRPLLMSLGEPPSCSEAPPTPPPPKRASRLFTVPCLFQRASSLALYPGKPSPPPCWAPLTSCLPALRSKLPLQLRPGLSDTTGAHLWPPSDSHRGTLPPAQAGLCPVQDRLSSGPWMSHCIPSAACGEAVPAASGPGLTP